MPQKEIFAKPTFQPTTYAKLEKLAVEHDCIHNGKPSVAKFLKRVAKMVLMANATEEMQQYKEREGLDTLEAIKHSSRKCVKAESGEA